MLNEEREVLEYIKEAFSLRARKLYKPAVEMLYKALTLDNDNIEILYQLGELYALMENYTRATGYLDQVIAKNSEHIESLKLYQRICETQNELDKSLKFAEKLFDINKNSENLKEIITLLSKLNQTDNLEKYADSEFLNSDIIFEIANALYSNGETEKAKKLLITRQNDNCAQINILLGKIYFDENNLQKSKEIFAAFDKNCDNPEVLNYRGLFALEDMNFSDAIKFFSKASSINKNNHIYLYNLGNAYFLNGWMEEAQNAYSRAIYLAPENTDYRYSLSYLYYEIKKADKCKKEVDAILEASHNHYPTRVLKALLLDNDKE